MIIKDDYMDLEKGRNKKVNVFFQKNYYLLRDSTVYNTRELLFKDG